MVNINTFKSTVWLTGINGGIGRELAQQLVRQGYRVVGFDRNLNQVQADTQYHLVKLDICQSEAVQQCCQDLMSKYPPDIFIHVAGVLHLALHEYTDIENWEHSFAVNVHAPFYYMKSLTPYFKEKRSGVVVMVSSNAAHVPRMHMAAYGASKAALTSFAKTAGLELASYGVRVNIVSPGSTSTDMLKQLWTDSKGEQKIIEGNPNHYKVGVPLKKIAYPSDIAKAILFLISDSAGHITMHDLVIDGGATLGC